MKGDASKILEAALKLPVEARAAIAGSLIESLDEEVDENIEAAWAEEIAQRVRDLDSGKVKAIPWSKARRLILQADRKNNRGCGRRSSCGRLQKYMLW